MVLEELDVATLRIAYLLAKSFSCFWTLWAVARQAPLSMGFSRQEYWSGLPCPSPGDLPNPGIKPRSPALQTDSLLFKLLGKPKNTGVNKLSLLQGIFRARNSTGVSCIAGDSLPAEILRKPQSDFHGMDMLHYFTHVWLFATPWTIAHQAPLCPGNFPGKITGVGGHSLLQEIFLTQGPNSGLLHHRQFLYHLSYQ